MKIKYFILLIMFIFILTGCETHKEISDLGMVSAMGIEKINDKYLVSVQVANIKKSTKMGTDNSSKVTLYTGKGNTSFEAIREILNKSSKKLYFPHIKLIILSDEVIDENPKQIIDFFSRDNEGNMKAYVLVSTDYTPNEILSTITSFEDVPAEYIYNLLMISEASYGNTHTLTFEDFVDCLIKDNEKLYFTKISLTDNNEEKNNTDVLNSINLPTYITLGNILVFNKEKKLVELSKDESIVLNLINGKSNNSIISLKCDNNDNYYTLELMSNSSSIIFNSKNNKVNINLNLTYSISEYNCDKSLVKNENIAQIKREISNKLDTDIKSLISKSIEYENDFIGLKKVIKNKDVKNINFDTNIKINLENRGDLLNIIKKEGKNE